MAFTNRVTTVTQSKLVPKVVDTVLNSNVFLTRILTRAKKWNGSSMKFPIKYQNGTSGSSFSGYDTFSTNASERRINMEFDPKFYEKPISLPLTEVDVNDTDEKTLDLIKVEMAMASQEMADELGTMFYSDGTGNSSKDFLGLTALVDDGGAVANIGGLARATYTTLQSTDTASGGTLSLAKMATLYNAITSGTQKPSIILTTEAVFSFYEQLLQPMERITVNTGLSKGLVGAAGFTGLAYKGVPVIADEKCTSGVMFMLNEDYIDFYAVQSKMNKPVEYSPEGVEGNDYSSVKGLGFSWTGWIRPTNAYAIVGHVILGGELITNNPKRHGKLTGITGV